MHTGTLRGIRVVAAGAVAAALLLAAGIVTASHVPTISDDEAKCHQQREAAVHDHRGGERTDGPTARHIL